RHALKTGILPVVTVIFKEIAFLIGGLVVTETVFNLPGVARFLVQAILWRDYPVVQNLVMFIAIVVILSNLAVDMLYGVLEPRVRCVRSTGRDRNPRAPSRAQRRGRGAVAIRPQEAPRRRRRRADAGDAADGGLRGSPADPRSDCDRRGLHARRAERGALARHRPSRP